MCPSRKLAMQQRYAERHGRDLLGDYLARELEMGDRVVCRNEAWVVVVPFWAVWPFETMLIPVRMVDDLRALTRDERDQLADILRRLTVQYDNLFQCSFPYSMGWHGRPVDGPEHPGCRLHAVCFPPLLRSATVRKFLVGYEMTGEPQRDLTAETAAVRLRGQSDVHYLIPRRVRPRSRSLCVALCLPVSSRSCCSARLPRRRSARLHPARPFSRPIRSPARDASSRRR